MAHEVFGSLKSRIADNGPIRFSDFMSMALYDQHFGYYMGVGNPYAHYGTSASMHPVFGGMLSNHVKNTWNSFGQPGQFAVVELGCGEGRIAESILAISDETNWGQAMEYIGVEIGPGRRCRANKLRGLELVSDIEEIEYHEYCLIIANEYFDSLPFDILKRHGLKWLEMRVGVSGNGRDLGWIPYPAEDDAVQYATKYGSNVPDGGQLEFRPDMERQYHRISNMSSTLAMTVIDYGGSSSEIHSGRFPKGTALAYGDNGISENLLQRPGLQDLTAHVNFDHLTGVAKQYGIRSATVISQAQFLTDLGIGDYLPYLYQSGVSGDRYSQERESIAQLLDPLEMGRFKVMFQYSGSGSKDTL
tara:strand:+ start:935 stop:2014 length:1080 start_codon:yes stop_codon:yes gene_type:complete